MIKIRIDTRGLTDSLKSQLSREVRREATKVSRQVLAQMREATPVDTGRARSGWNASTPDRNGRFVLSNSVPYIGALNAGHSRQAPQRFIEGVALKFGRAVGIVVSQT